VPIHSLFVDILENFVVHPHPCAPSALEQLTGYTLVVFSSQTECLRPLTALHAELEPWEARFVNFEEKSDLQL